MNIGVDFTHNFEHSGIGTYNRELVRAMATISPDERFVLFTQFNKAACFNSFFCDSANCQIIEAFPSPKLFGKAAVPAMLKIRSAIWHLASKRLDLVHFTYPVLYSQTCHKTIATIHDLIPLYNASYTGINKRKLGKYRVDLITRDSSRIIVPSHFVRQELEKYFPESIHKTHVIYEGSKPIFKQALADTTLLSQYGITDSRPFFLYVGRLEKRKNLDNILKAFRALSDISSKEAILVLICNGIKRETDELYRQICDLGMTDVVRHLQGVTDEHLVHFYNAALALLFVSFSEGFGLPLVEAMNCGCPAIISNVSSLPEIASGSALAVDPTVVGQIVESMQQILENSALRKTLSQQGLIVAQNYSWKQAAKETLEVYRMALQ